MSVASAAAPKAAVARPMAIPGNTGRAFFYIGALTVPMLTLRLVGESATISDAFFAAATLAAIAMPRAQHRPAPRLLPAVAYLLLLGGGLAAWRADLLTDHLTNVARLAFVATVLPWVTIQLLRTRRHVAVAAACWATGSALSGTLAVIQTQVPLLAPETNTSGRVLGFADHPTDAGGLLSIALPVAMAFAVGNARPTRRLLWMGAVGLIGIGMVLSASVSSFAAGAVGVVVLAMRLRVGLRTFLLTAVGAVVAVRVGTSNQADDLALSPLERLQATTSGQYATADYRLQTDRFAIDRILENPLIGAGLDPLSGVTVMGLQTHNMFLALWFQGGLLMLLGVVAVLWRAGRRSLARHDRRDLLRSALCASLAAMLVFAMTSPLLAQRYLWMPVVLLLALPTLRAGQTDWRSERT